MAPDQWGEVGDVVVAEAGGFLQTKLVDQESRDRTGNFDIGAREDADESCRSQHERKAEAVVVAAQPIGDLPIASVQMKILRQLIRRRSSGKIGIALPLFVGQVAGGHIVRNLRLLRRVNETQKTWDIFLAKYLCGSHYFSNMFCNARKALA
jgi:Na+/glutamate symporter